MKLNKNKKSTEIFSLLVIIILAIAVLIILILIVTKIRDSINEKTKNLECDASIETHISFIEAKYFIEDEAQERAGVASLFLPDLDQPAPDIKCPPKITKSNVKTQAEAEKEILKSALTNWYLFKQGDALIYDEITDKNVCIILDVFEFKKELELDLIIASRNTFKNELVGGTDTSVVSKEIVFSESPVLNADSIECNVLLDDIAQNLEDLVSISDGKISIDYPNSFLENVNTLGYLIANNLTSNCDQSKLNKIKDIAKYSGSHSFVKDTKEPIAIVFTQAHLLTVSKGGILGLDFVNFVGEAERLINHKKVPNYLNYFSSINIIPYTQNNLKLIGCEVFPVPFED